MDPEELKLIKQIAKLAVFALLGLIIFFGSWATVSAGNKGVRVTMGKVSPDTLQEGLHLKWPLIQNIVEMDGHNTKYADKAATYTKDIQTANLNFTLNYQLDPSHANEVYRNFGRDWEQALVPQIVLNSIKSIIGQWDAVEVVENRQKAVDQIEANVREKLAPYGVKVQNFAIDNIDFNAEFEKANEAKVTAVQRAIEAQNHTKQVTEEASQKVIAAKAEAESMSIRSQALAQNHGLVEYEAVQKWDGKLPVTMLGGATPFINLGGTNAK